MPLQVAELKNSNSSQDIGVDQATASQFEASLEAGYSEGKLPLFVLGAGISARRVPLIKEIAQWLVIQLRQRNIDEPMLIKQGEMIQAGQASRTAGAEFFSTLQDPSNQHLKTLWDDFCRKLVLEGVTLPETRFSGLYKLTMHDDTADEILKGPSFAHKGIAAFLGLGACNVLNLNYDPLLLLAMDWVQEQREKNLHTGILDQNASFASADSSKLKLITLYTPREVTAYFSSPDRQFQPAVTNARGDVFYVHCINSRCPRFKADLSLDIYGSIANEETIFLCSACRLKTLKLQMAFPGYQTKEQLIQPVLQELWKFIGNLTSAVIVIGLSGQWDPYVLEALFRWGLERAIPIVDVKPSSGKDELQREEDPNLYFERFRSRFFPSVFNKLMMDRCAYVRWCATADRFLKFLVEIAPKIGVVLPFSSEAEC